MFASLTAFIYAHSVCFGVGYLFQTNLLSCQSPPAKNHRFACFIAVASLRWLHCGGFALLLAEGNAWRLSARAYAIRFAKRFAIAVRHRSSPSQLAHKAICFKHSFCRIPLIFGARFARSIAICSLCSLSKVFNICCRARALFTFVTAILSARYIYNRMFTIVNVYPFAKQEPP